MSSKKRKSSCPFESTKIPCEQLVSSTTNEKETNCLHGSSEKAPQRKKSGKRFQNWGDAFIATNVPASSRRSFLHWTRKTFDIF